MNTFGSRLRLTTFGESHGKAIGGVIDGFPPGFEIDFKLLYQEISKRSPGKSKLTSQRKESDLPEFLSGINENGLTLGTSIGFIIPNNDVKSKDYSELDLKFRPNHADYTYEIKYGLRNPYGGGRASARETANWVVAGGLAQQWLKKTYDIDITAILTGVGTVSFVDNITATLCSHPFELENLVLPNHIENLMETEIQKAKNDGDSVGGNVTCIIHRLPAGVGEPVFDKLQSRLAQAMLSINAVKGFEYGIGMTAAKTKGSETLDNFRISEINKVFTQTNYSGGIQGGISNGMPVFFNVAFKPTPTIMKEVTTISVDLHETTLKMKGRHDPCVAVRGVPVVKAMTALVVMDMLLV